MTPERLAELRTLAEAATPGPWSIATVEGQGFAVHRGEHDTIALYCERPDAAFIAAARQAIPELLGEVERLTAERAVWFGENSGAQAALGRCRALAEALEELTVPCTGPGCAGCTAGRLRAAIDGEA